jgi:hypothetical protein
VVAPASHCRVVRKETLGGAGLGAGAGAILGAAVGAPGAGAAIGGLLAGATGFALETGQKTQPLKLVRCINH